MRLLVLLGFVAGCGGESVVVTESALVCEPSVVLANPGPSERGGCFRVVAGERSTVRLVGDDGPGEATVDVHAGDGYEVLTCSDDWGAPKLSDCGGSK